MMDALHLLLLSIEPASLYLALHEFFCATLAWGVFCRFAKGSSTSVSFVVRVAFWSLGAGAIVGLVAPWTLGYAPTQIDVIVRGTFALVQLATVSLWAAGPPRALMPEHAGPPRRRATDCAHVAIESTT